MWIGKKKFEALERASRDAKVMHELLVERHCDYSKAVDRHSRELHDLKEFFAVLKAERHDEEVRASALNELLDDVDRPFTQREVLAALKAKLKERK